MLVISRPVWEWLDPVGPEGFKGLLYARDYAVLLPAGGCWVVSIISRERHRMYRGTGGLDSSLGNTRGAGLVLSCLVMVGCLTISGIALRTRAHTLDEACYLFQAKVLSLGRVWADAPRLADFFDLEYMVVDGSKWYGSFFPGQSALLVPGVMLGAPFLVNPILTGLLLLECRWAGNKLFGAPTAALGAVMMVISPFVLFQGASYFSHVSTALLLVPSAVWIILSRPSGLRAPILAGLCVGGILLFRPLTAIIMGIFAGIRWYSIGKRQSWRSYQSLCAIAVFALAMLPGLIMLLSYNHALTGRAFVTPHQVALTGDHLSLGAHTISNSAINAFGLSVDLLGAPLLSLAPLLFYFLQRRSPWRLEIALLAVLYAVGYGLYPYHGLSYGPRFYFELTPLLLLCCAQGLLDCPWRLVRTATSVLAMACAGIALLGIVPSRIVSFGQRARYYDIREVLARVPSQRAIVFIEDEPRARLFPYIAGFQLNDVNLSGSVIFARDLGERNQDALRVFPERSGYLLDLRTKHLEPIERNPALSRHGGE